MEIHHTKGSFHYSCGECIWLAGPNGSGKTELLKWLAHNGYGVLVPARYSKPLFMNEEARRRMEGAQQLLEMGSRNSVLGKADELKARIALALARKADLLLLDNPVEGMDIQNRQAALQALRQLAHKTGMAILFTSHEFSDSLSVAHRVLAITPGGSLVESTPDTRLDTLRAAFPLATIE